MKRQEFKITKKKKEKKNRPIRIIDRKNVYSKSGKL